MIKVICIDNPSNDQRITIGGKYLYKLSNNGKYFSICRLNGFLITSYSCNKSKHMFMDEIELRDNKIDEICGVML